MTDKPWTIAYDRSRRAWGVVSAGSLIYEINAPDSPNHGKTETLPAGFYTGGGPDRARAQTFADELNAKGVYRRTDLP